MTKHNSHAMDIQSIDLSLLIFQIDRWGMVDTNIWGFPYIFCLPIQVYIVVLSPESCCELKDELSLAYVSNKAIYPLARKYYRKIAERMEGGV